MEILLNPGAWAWAQMAVLKLGVWSAQSCKQVKELK